MGEARSGALSNSNSAASGRTASSDGAANGVSLKSNTETVLTEWRKNLKRVSHRLLSRKVNQRADTSDVVQEGLIQIWQSLDKIYGESAAERESLSRKIARGHACKLERQHHAQKRSVNRTEAAKGEHFSSIDDPPTLTSKREDCLKMTRALQEIDTGYQEILQLVFFQGLPLTEVSRRVGKSYKVVRRLYEKSLDALQLQMNVKTP